MHFGVQAPNLAQMFRTVQKGCQKSDLHGEGEGEGRGNFFKVPYVTKLLETFLNVEILTSVSGVANLRAQKVCL